MVILRLELTEIGPMTAARFAGEGVSLDGAATDMVRKELFTVADHLGGAELSLDLSNIAFLHGTILGVLLMLSRRLHAAGQQFWLVNPQPQVAEVFRVAQLSALFEPPRQLAV